MVVIGQSWWSIPKTSKKGNRSGPVDEIFHCYRKFVGEFLILTILPRNTQTFYPSGGSGENCDSAAAMATFAPTIASNPPSFMDGSKQICIIHLLGACSG